jgi:tetratricopeptide (TPR) repeat protein
MGTVWLARQNSLGGRLVAVKVLSRSLGSSPRSRARFRAEAQAIGKLRHMNIVQVFDVLQGEGLQAYAMEWVDGSTLARIIERVKGIDASRRGHDSSMHCVREALGSAPASDDSTSSALDRNYIVFVCRVGVAVGRAYPRLRKAVEAFPNVGFLTVHLAEAATKCGDFDKAQRWLDQAGAMPRLDRFNGLKRVQAGLHAAAGHDEQARQLYEELLVENQNIVAFHDYAQYLDARGDLERAVAVYLLVIGHGFVDPNVYRHFTDVTERWWETLEPLDQQRLAGSVEPWTDYRHDRHGILPTYARCLTVLGQEPPPGGIPRRPPQRASGP